MFHDWRKSTCGEKPLLCSQFFCTFTETGGDSFDLRGRDDEDSASVEIIGGSGKWTGATGAGTWKRKWGQGNRGTFEYEVKITTP